MNNRFRRLLIQVICFLVLFNYAETAFALATSNFLAYNGVVIPNTSFSFLIGHYFEYNLQMLVVMVIISIAIETGIYNKLACGYLGINLLEKSCFDFEISIEMIYIIAIANILVSGYIIFKGVKITFTKNKRNGIKTIN